MERKNNIRQYRQGTKAAVYAAYGIEYKAGKIFSPVFGWIAPLLKNGNHKIGTGVYHFSTLPTDEEFSAIGEKTAAILAAAGADSMRGTCGCTCKDAGTGEVTCYATKGRYVFDNVRASLMINTFLAREYPAFFACAVQAQILADRVKVVRIHAAGDFFSREYAEAWRAIAIANPAVLFWTYTKRRDLENVFDGLSNANIVKSFVRSGGRTSYNFGPCGKMAALYKALKAAGEDVYFCPCGIKGYENGVKCNSCAACAVHKYVLFVEHSTSYNAATDPALADVIAILESQGAAIAA